MTRDLINNFFAGLQPIKSLVSYPISSLSLDPFFRRMAITSVSDKIKKWFNRGEKSSHTKLNKLTEEELLLSIQGHPTNIFGQISVRHSKNFQFDVAAQ